MLSNGAHVSIVSSEDLLYLGTYNGLSVYDGLNVKSYNYEQGLPNGFIAEIFEDSEGYIWIGYGLKGIVKWKSGKVIRHYTKEDGLPSNRVNAIAQNKDGNLLIGTANGLSIFNGKKFTNHDFTSGLGNGFITDIKVIGNNVWIGSGKFSKTGGDQTIGGGLSLFNGKTFKSFDLTSLQNLDMEISAISVIEQDNNGNMWIGTEGGLLKYDGSKFHIMRNSDGLPNNWVRDILIDDNGIWACTGWGLVNIKDDIIKTIVPIDKKINLSFQFIDSISKSKDGIYFIGTGNGVLFYDPTSFRKITSHEGLPIPNNWTRGILDLKLDRNGHLWAASGWDGIYKLSDEIILDHFNTENSNIPINYTQQMEFANDGSVWFVHAQGGVSRYANGEIEDMTKYLKIPSSTSVNDIAFDNENNIWLATSRALRTYKPVTHIKYG
jgi:ligand-binding sensor domain-containing protein